MSESLRTDRCVAYVIVFAVSALLLSQNASCAPDSTEFRLPSNWTGLAKGEAAGNPFEKDGKPLWEAARVWPAEDVFNKSSYIPMVWSGSGWEAADHNHGGQPNIRIFKTTVELQARGPWVNFPGKKQPAPRATPPT